MREIDYQERVVECAKRASSALNDTARGVWRQMEEFWRRKAFAPPLKVRKFVELNTIDARNDTTRKTS